MVTVLCCLKPYSAKTLELRSFIMGRGTREALLLQKGPRGDGKSHGEVYVCVWGGGEHIFRVVLTPEL